MDPLLIAVLVAGGYFFGGLVSTGESAGECGFATVTGVFSLLIILCLWLGRTFL